MYCYKRLAVAVIIVASPVLVSCDRAQQQEVSYEEELDLALSMIGKNRQNISLPKVPYPVSTRARMAKVDAILSYPPDSIDLGRRLKDVKRDGKRSEYVDGLVQLLDIGKTDSGSPRIASRDSAASWVPAEWNEDTPLPTALRAIAAEIEKVRVAWESYGGKPSPSELEAISGHLKNSISYAGTDKDEFLLIPETYHTIGKRVNVAGLASAVLQLLATVESVLPELTQLEATAETIEWGTPLGLVRVAGNQNDRHEGNFLLLIDLAGDDSYVDVGSALVPGNVSVVVDLDGNDRINWKDVPGPGSGVLGMGIWLDMAGNDSYEGSNAGLGNALFGAGVFWDEQGDDVYNAGVLVEGAGQYGIGVFVDAQGRDKYRSSMAGQGFGGPGGVGIFADFSGNDEYTCGGRFPDLVEKRASRHRGKHYLGMCQGYSFGLRPDTSGGIGVLIDHAGDDNYKADMFAQGGSYWFALGMLIDASGNDRYEAYEHCQGESLHLSAGFLGDWGGNDEYIGYEHCQGVGIDRAAGVLYEKSGDDTYWSHHESQGTGVKPYGVGILIDEEGADRYEALRDSQGYAKPDPVAPDLQWPTGILLDLAGKNTFIQPYTEPIDSMGRIQNRQGVAIDRGDGSEEITR